MALSISAILFLFQTSAWREYITKRSPLGKTGGRLDRVGIASLTEVKGQSTVVSATCNSSSDCGQLTIRMNMDDAMFEPPPG